MLTAETVKRVTAGLKVAAGIVNFFSTVNYGIHSTFYQMCTGPPSITLKLGQFTANFSPNGLYSRDYRGRLFIEYVI
jgi:hypothetical protein